MIKFYKFIIGPKIKYIKYYKNRIFHLLKNKFFLFKKWSIVYVKPIYNLVSYLNIKNNNYFKSCNIDNYSNRLLKKIIRLQKILFNTTKSIDFNKYKFNSLSVNFRNLGLISMIEKLYNKRVIVNFVEKKSIHLNSDVFSSAVALKLRNRNNKVVRILRKAIVKMVRIPDLHSRITSDDCIKAMNKNNIINTIKQQVVNGIRFEASGRLTRRLIAMRAVLKYRCAGSLKNIRSSFNNLSSALLRGYAKSNLQYININSKTRNGTFGVKTWVSSHNFRLPLEKYNILFCSGLCLFLVNIFLDKALVKSHYNIMFYLVAILFSVGLIQTAIIRNFGNAKSPISNKYLNNGTLEWIYTITPAFILVLIAFPFFKLLFLMDEVIDPWLSVSAENYPWYWNYQYPNFLNSDGDFVEFDSYLVAETDLDEGTLRMLEVNNGVILPDIVHNWSLFKVIQCSSPSNANKAFQGLDVVVKPKLDDLCNIQSNPLPHLDFSRIEDMLAELKNNAHSMSEDRITTLEKNIKDNLNQLKVKGNEAHSIFFPQFLQLYTVFNDLSSVNEFKDLYVVMDKVNKLSLEDTPKPPKSLLESDPIKFWKEQVKCANRLHDQNITILNLLKNYVKSNDLLSTQHKTELFTAIKNLQKTAANIATTDKTIFKENIESSKILTELRNIRTK